MEKELKVEIEGKDILLSYAEDKVRSVTLAKTESGQLYLKVDGKSVQIKKDSLAVLTDNGFTSIKCEILIGGDIELKFEG